MSTDTAIQWAKGEPMKAEDFKTSALCGKGVMHNGVPLFYRCRITPMGIDARAVQQTHGLEQMFGGVGGGARLARVMGPDPDIAKPITEEQTALVCQDCSMQPHLFAMLAERAA